MHIDKSTPINMFNINCTVLMFGYCARLRKFYVKGTTITIKKLRRMNKTLSLKELRYPDLTWRKASKTIKNK